MKRLPSLLLLHFVIICCIYRCIGHLWCYCFFSPDIGAAGYLANNITGTVLYNLLHHKLLALVMIGSGYLIGENWLAGLGLLYFAHSSFDRALGYGLKYPGNPGKTHLGYIGKEKYKNSSIPV